MKKLKSIILSIAAIATVALPLVPASTFAADANAFKDCPKNASQYAVCASSKDSGDLTNLIHTIINVLLFIIGAVAVVVIIIAGIQYVISGGDSGAVARAKNTLMYAIIGLIVAILAYAIVTWVYQQFK